MSSVEKVLHCYEKSRGAGDDGQALVWALLAKSAAQDAGLASLKCDMMAVVGDIRYRINRQRKREGLGQAPIATFAGANASDQQILDGKCS